MPVRETFSNLKSAIKTALSYLAVSIATASAVFLLGMLLSGFPEGMAFHIKLLRALGVMLFPASLLVGGIIVFNVISHAKKENLSDLSTLCSLAAGLIVVSFLQGVSMFLMSFE